jgi:restriction system protein
MRRSGRKGELSTIHHIVLFVILLASLIFFSTLDDPGARVASLIPPMLALVINVAVVGSISILILLAHALRRWINRKKYLSSDIHKVDLMSGEEFENFLATHFAKQGYRAKTTAASNDYGADLVISKGGVKTVVQAKRYKDNVGIKAVQEVVGAIAYYKADKGMVITNSYFTSNAKELAASNGIVLWDRNKLVSEFQISK